MPRTHLHLRPPDTALAAPLFAQIANAITDHIRGGRLTSGDVLPGSRALARELGVDRDTVIAAYGDLEAQGLLTSVPRTGTVVADPPRGVGVQRGLARQVGFALDPGPVRDRQPEPPPGAILLAAGLAVAQERGLTGRDLLTAFIAGSEVMIRIGRATRHTNEQRGFHAPGTTGPFGGAIAVGKLLGFDAGKMTNALGIAGSLCCGLMEFARSGTGAMVKRLHLGRAAESGVLAASLVADGFTGPVSVIEGEHGFLRVFCRDTDDGELLRGLGQTWSTRTILMKRFACHISAHTSVQAILDLRAEHGFSGNDVAAIRIAGNEKMAKVNNIPRPKDVMMGQYSIPFSVALAHFRDPRDPRSFDEGAFNDAAIRSLCERVTITVASGHHDHATLRAEVEVELKDGRVLRKTVEDFKGTPESPLDRAGVRERFMLLTRHCPPGDMERLLARLQNIENETSLDWLAVEAAAKAA
jgi:2-methylcitrate dehydratase PrpD